MNCDLNKFIIHFHLSIHPNIDVDTDNVYINISVKSGIIIVWSLGVWFFYICTCVMNVNDFCHELVAELGYTSIYIHTYTHI